MRHSMNASHLRKMTIIVDFGHQDEPPEVFGHRAVSGGLVFTKSGSRAIDSKAVVNANWNLNSGRRSETCVTTLSHIQVDQGARPAW